jgi:hypothetical protein
VDAEAATASELMAELQAQHEGPAARQLAQLQAELAQREASVQRQQCRWARGQGGAASIACRLSCKSTRRAQSSDWSAVASVVPVIAAWRRNTRSRAGCRRSCIRSSRTVLTRWAVSCVHVGRMAARHAHARSVSVHRCSRYREHAHSSATAPTPPQAAQLADLNKTLQALGMPPVWDGAPAGAARASPAALQPQPQPQPQQQQRQMTQQPALYSTPSAAWQHQQPHAYSGASSAGQLGAMAPPTTGVCQPQQRQVEQPAACLTPQAAFEQQYTVEEPDEDDAGSEPTPPATAPGAATASACTDLALVAPHTHPQPQAAAGAAHAAGARAPRRRMVVQETVVMTMRTAAACSGSGGGLVAGDAGVCGDRAQHAVVAHHRHVVVHEVVAQGTGGKPSAGECCGLGDASTCCPC